MKFVFYESGRGICIRLQFVSLTCTVVTLFGFSDPTPGDRLSVPDFFAANHNAPQLFNNRNTHLCFA